MTLAPSFSLTPRTPLHFVGPHNMAHLWCWGTTFFPATPNSLEALYTADQLYFQAHTASDPATDYTVHGNRVQAPHVEIFFDLQAWGVYKELALVFSFEAVSDSRVLLFSAAGLQEDLTLFTSDDRLLIEVEDLSNPLNLYFIHVQVGGQPGGGHWRFNGIRGYVV